MTFTIILCPLLTLYHSQHPCNLQWPDGVCDDASNCWHLNPAPGPHLLVPVKPARCPNVTVKSQHQVKNKNKNCIIIYQPCHSWHFPSRCGCTWASPWQPPARPAQCPPSTETWVWSSRAQPVGGGLAGPLTHLTGWGCGVWGWRGYLSLGGQVVKRMRG